MDLLKRAGEYFKNHVSVHTFHFTSDGMAFQVKTDAEAHARTLTDTEVKTVLRADVEVADEVVPGGVTSTSLSEQNAGGEPEPEDEPEPEIETKPDVNKPEKEAKTTTKAKAGKK